MTTLPDLDLMLDVRLETWQAVPDTLPGIVAWDPDERREFLYELPVEAELVSYLEQLCDQGLLTPEQTARLRTVQALVQARRAILDAYLADTGPPISVDVKGRQ